MGNAKRLQLFVDHLEVKGQVLSLLGFEEGLEVRVCYVVLLDGVDRLVLAYHQSVEGVRHLQGMGLLDVHLVEAFIEALELELIIPLLLLAAWFHQVVL